MSRWNRFVSANYEWAAGKANGDRSLAYHILSGAYNKYKPYLDLIGDDDLRVSILHNVLDLGIIASKTSVFKPPQTIDYYTYRKNNYDRIKRYLEEHQMGKPTFKQILAEVSKQWKETNEFTPLSEGASFSKIPPQGTPFMVRVYNSPYIYYIKNKDSYETSLLMDTVNRSAYSPNDEEYTKNNYGGGGMSIIKGFNAMKNVAYINDERLKDGASNCVLTPILEVFDDRRFYIKKKYGNNMYADKIQMINDYLEKKSDEGVGYDDLKQICEDVSVSIHIHEITNDKYFSYVPTKRSILAVNYIHTRFGHVDHIFSDINKQSISKREMTCLYEKLNNSGDPFVFKTVCGINSIYEINTFDTIYRVQTDEFTSFYSHLVDQLFAIDHTADKDISNFVSSGCHVNTRCNLVENIYEKYNNKEVYCVDHNKSYSNYEHNKFYMGFPISITELVNLKLTQDDIYTLPVGLYKITNIDLSCERAIYILRCYIDENVYTLPDLYFLHDIGAKFDIIAGAYGNSGNITMREDKYEKLDGVPYYSLASGRLMSLSKYKHIWYNKINDVNLFGHFKKTYGMGVDMFEDGSIKISKKIEKRYHYRHVASYITAYSRISTLYMYLQMCKIGLNVLRIVSDGIYFDGDYSKIDYDTKYFKIEKKCIQGFSSCDSYISTYRKPYNINRFETAPKWHRVELYNGQGGCGKTHKALTYYGKNSCFVCVCWNLSERKRCEYNIPQNTVVAKLLGQECEAEKIRYPVLVIDEITMLNPSVTIEIIKMFPKHKIILCGDYDSNWKPNQLMPVVDDITQLTPFSNVLKHIDNIHVFETNHRIKCERLINLLDKKNTGILPKLTPKEVANMACDDDIILTSLRICKSCKKYFGCGCVRKNGLQLFNSMEYPNRTYKKYMITKKCLYNGTKHFRGQIIKEKIPTSEYRAAQTIHQIQGDTIKAPKKIFIDTRDMFDPNALYVALSRAEEISQLYLIKT